MNKIIEYIKNQDNSLMATIILFIVGVLVAFLGAISIAVTSSAIFFLFGGLVILMGAALVIFGFMALVVFLDEM